jgi:nitroimidazol reductase NimA-like FMN-containing flavoprotein (pyridoxamine 5'-phosphate oxidase superfamily)
MAAGGTKPTVRMTESEAWEFLERSHTGIVTTLRRDGRPVALPVWFVVLDGHIYVRTRGRKVERARHDPRCSFLVEDGERWAQLRAVHVACRVEVIDPSPELAERIEAAIAEKYSAYRTPAREMPAATRDHYQQNMGAVLDLVPEGKLLTWDNGKLGLE